MTFSWSNSAKAVSHSDINGIACTILEGLRKITNNTNGYNRKNKRKSKPSGLSRGIKFIKDCVQCSAKEDPRYLQLLPDSGFSFLRPDLHVLSICRKPEAACHNMYVAMNTIQNAIVTKGKLASQTSATCMHVELAPEFLLVNRRQARTLSKQALTKFATSEES